MIMSIKIGLIKLIVAQKKVKNRGWLGQVFQIRLKRMKTIYLPNHLSNK
jgi:hypothetical protein